MRRWLRSFDAHIVTAMAWTSRWPYCPCFGVSHLRRTVSAMTELARVLGLGLDLVQALPRRGRVSAIFSIATLLIFARWPELLLEVARLRVEPIRDFVVESLEGLGSHTGTDRNEF
jgi:hypothetical protein